MFALRTLRIALLPEELKTEPVPSSRVAANVAGSTKSNPPEVKLVLPDLRGLGVVILAAD